MTFNLRQGININIIISSSWSNYYNLIRNPGNNNNNINNNNNNNNSNNDDLSHTSFSNIVRMMENKMQTSFWKKYPHIQAYYYLFSSEKSTWSFDLSVSEPRCSKSEKKLIMIGLQTLPCDFTLNFMNGQKLYILVNSQFLHSYNKIFLTQYVTFLWIVSKYNCIQIYVIIVHDNDVILMNLVFQW